MAAIFASVGVAVGAAIWLGYLAWPKTDQSDSPAPAPSPMPTTNAAPPPATPPTSAPPPATITVQAEPTVPTSTSTAYDRQFITNLQYNGWVMWDAVSMIDLAHKVCNLLEMGETPDSVIRLIIDPPEKWPPGRSALQEGTVFVNTAMATYPNCG